MNERTFFSILRSWVSRGWVLYAVLAVAALVLVDVRKMSSHAKPSTLSRLRPNYSFLGAFADGAESIDRKALEDQRVYLENVTAVMGRRPDADALLGYVFFCLGKKSRAEELFIRSTKLNPTFFWSYYNLGVLAYSQGQTGRAREFLQTAVQLNPELSVKFLLTSRIFAPLMSDSNYSPQRFLENLYAGYADAYKMLVMTEFSGQEFGKASESAQSGLKMAPTAADRSFFLYFIGASALKAGALSTAVKAFEECLKLDAEHPEALAGMALVLKSVGQQDIAAAFVERARTARPKRESALPRPDEFRIRVF